MPNTLINGIDIYYEEQGEGIPVLFIHGGFGGAESSLYPKNSVFLNVLPPERFRTIVYDRRSGGRSGYVTKHYTLDDLAAEARGLMRHLGIEKSMVVGDSLGGVVAQKYALTYPEAVTSLLLVETGSAILKVSKLITVTLLVSRFVPVRPFFRFFKKYVLSPQFYDPLGPLTEDEIADRRRHHEEYTRRLQTLPEDELFRYSMGLLRNYAAFANTDLTDQVGKLSMPIDIMHGTADKVVHYETGRKMFHAMPQAKFHDLPGLGHGVFYYLEGREMGRMLVEQQVAAQQPMEMAAGD